VGLDFPSASALVTCLAFGPDGTTLLVGVDQGTLYFRNFASRTEKATLAAHVGWVKSLALASDGKTLVTGGNDGFVRIWDVAKVSGK
jgi:WD40 repeat protein